MANTPGSPTMLGHLALRVRDVDRAVSFYRDVLGLGLKSRPRPEMAFLGNRPDASHELALFQLPADAEGPDAARAGLYHMAWEMASVEELETLHARLVEHKAEIVGYSDQQCNVMFLDPDGNELEAIYEPSAEEEARLKAAGEPMPTLKH